MHDHTELSQAPSDEIVTLLNDCARLQKSNELLKEQVRALLVLQSISNALNAELDLPRLLRQVNQAALRLVNCSVSALMIMNPTSEVLIVEAMEYHTPNGAMPLQARRSLALEQGVAGWVAGNAVAVIAYASGGDSRFSPEQIAADARVLGVSPSVLCCVPLVFKGRVIGVLETAHTTPDEGFDARDLDLLRTLAAQAATAVANARLYQGLREERDRVISMQEDLRKHLARDLHDGPAQVMASIAMRLDFARKLAQHEPAKLDQELQGITEQVLHVTRDIREMLFDLRPLVLESEGLAVALQRFFERFQSLGGPKLHLVGQYQQRLPHHTEATVFAIIQEAVNNALKHAKARNCWIELREEPRSLIVKISDDGVGFDVEATRQHYAQRGSLGLLNMRERANLIDAIFSIQSHPGSGTTLTLTVPR
jgi:signal transduction histidine kinase